MKWVFVDASAWIAFMNEDDQYHQTAQLIFTRLARENTLLITTDYLISETVTWLRYRCGHEIAKVFATEVIATAKIIYTDAKIFAKTIDYFTRYHDQKFSFTDCNAFVQMRQHEIKYAFTFDTHFAIAGFELVD